MLLAHCGSLFLDPKSLQETAHHLATVEMLQKGPELSVAAAVDAVTRPALFHG